MLRPLSALMLTSVLITSALLSSAALAEPSAPAEPSTHVMLINGGQAPRANFLSHHHHLEDMKAALEARGLAADRITVFSSDGEQDRPDQARSAGRAPKGYWLIAGTRPGRTLNPTVELANTEWPGVTMRPATYASLKRWFLKEAQQIAPQDTLFIYVTDHGVGNTDRPGNGHIMLWREQLSVSELRALLQELKPGVRTVMAMSQCYSGSFAEAMYTPGQALPSGEVCGFFSTLPDRQAYGCYPGGRGKDKVGHGFHFIDGLTRHESFIDAHQEVLSQDDRPDVPIRTSDAFLKRQLELGAAAAGVEFEPFVDQQLRKAWQARGEREAAIRLLDRVGNAFGTFSPRSLLELRQHAGELPEMSDQVKEYRDRWKETLTDLKRDNIRRFLEKHPDWKPKLDPRKLTKLGQADAKKLLKKLLPRLLRFTERRKGVLDRARALQQKQGTSGQAWERLEMRHAVMLRLRTQLIRVAGEVYLAGEDQAGARKAYEALVACEDFKPGAPKAEAAVALEPPTPLPPFASEVQTISRVMPSWLGIRFRPLPEATAERQKLGRGAVAVISVFPDSPAAGAGLQQGDIVIGPPGAPFEEPRQIREWTMRSPQGEPLPIEIFRSGERQTVKLKLGPYPRKWPEMPGPPKVGDAAPKLSGLKVVRGDQPTGQSVSPTGQHMLFYWATWCGPCKRAVPELMAWSQKSNVPVYAITDEGIELVQGFLGKWEKPFMKRVVSDELRQSFVAHGVSGTPTFVLIDEEGVVTFRQVGYSPKKGLDLKGWDWSPSPGPQ